MVDGDAIEFEPPVVFPWKIMVDEEVGQMLSKGRAVETKFQSAFP